MITLYTFGPMFGLPDGSPFVVKAMVLLKMAGLAYRTDTGGFNKAPKGKLPYMEDDGTIVADTSFIRWHIEERYGIDLDRGLDAEQRAVGWAVEKMCESDLYWAIVHERWMDEANFAKGPRHFFDGAPAPLRPLVIAMVRRQVRRDLRGQGLGRHTRPEIARLAGAALSAVAGVLGSKPWLLGEAPSAADASAWAFVAGALSEHFPGQLRDQAARHASLLDYRDRGLARWFPDGV